MKSENKKQEEAAAMAAMVEEEEVAAVAQVLVRSPFLTVIFVTYRTARPASPSPSSWFDVASVGEERYKDLPISK